MPLSAVTKMFAVTDCKISKLLTDPAGGPATYSAAVDVPGIKAVTISGDVNVSELRGDNTLLDTEAVLGNITVSIEHAKMSLDALEVLMSGTAVDAGTTPNQTVTFGIDGGSATSPTTLNYFRLEAKSAGADPVAGSVRFTLPKLKLTSFPDMGLAEEDYRTVAFDARALPTLANGRWLTIQIEETATALTA